MLTRTAPRIETGALVDEATLAHIRTRSDFMGFFLITHCWGIIFASMAMFYYLPNPLTFLLAVMLIGTRQLGLAVLMHDAAHNALFKTLKWNDTLSNWLCAFPVMARTEPYRRYHLQHHMNTQQENDPDLVLSAPFPITRKSMKRKIIRDLTGQSAFHQRRAQIINALGTNDLPLHERFSSFWQKLGGALIANVFIFAICTTLFHWSFYFLLWMLPFFTWHMLITRIRNIAEHAMVSDDKDPLRNARSTRASLLERLFIAPYWVQYHVEHHAIMHVPCYHLPLLKRSMEARGLGDKMETASNYWQILKQATSRPNDEDKPGSIVHDGRKRSTRLAGNFTEGFKAQ